jgi:hypothetical protein
MPDILNLFMAVSLESRSQRAHVTVICLNFKESRGVWDFPNKTTYNSL